MAAKKPDKPQVQAPQYTDLTLPELRSSIDTFLSQGENTQKIQDFITQSASSRLEGLETLLPGYKEGVAAAQKVATSYAEGNFPSDVAQKVSQSAAFKGLTAGLQGPQRQTLEARDIAQTSADFQLKGLGMQQALRSEIGAQMPLQALNFAFTPQAIRQEQVSLAQYNNQLRNQQAVANAEAYNRQQMLNYQYAQQYGGSPFGSILGGLGGAGAGFAIGNAIAPGFGGLIGAGLGSQLGGGVGGAFGGAQGQQFGGIFSGLGGTVVGLGALDAGWLRKL